MTKEELEAMLIDADMPRAVGADLHDNILKLSVDFTDPKDSLKIANTHGVMIGVGPVDAMLGVLRSFGAAARDRIQEQRAKGLVPYHAIARDPITLRAV